MAYDRVVSEIVNIFFLITCERRRPLEEHSVDALRHCAPIVTSTAGNDDLADIIPLITGSVAEFYIRPMFSCVGDVDIMFHSSNQLAIPAGTAPPTQLPDEFDSHVKVSEIIDGEFPGYVYLVSSYLLTECIDDGKYNAVQCRRKCESYGDVRDAVVASDSVRHIHGRLFLRFLRI